MHIYMSMTVHRDVFNICVYRNVANAVSTGKT